MKKRILSLCLALVMLFCAAVTAAAAPFEAIHEYKESMFADVAADQWYAPYVRQAYELGLMKGVGADSFRPNGNLTIAESVALAARLHSIACDTGAEFTQGSVWYQVYVDYAVAQQIIEENDYADYGATATRSQFAQIFAKALPAEDLIAINRFTNEIPDVAETADYAEAVYLLYNAGVLTGSDKYGTFNPDSRIMRSEVSTIVTRMADKSLRQVFTLKVSESGKEEEKEPSAWEELTKDDKVNFNTLTSTCSDAIDCIEAALDLVVSLGSLELPVPIQTTAECQENMASAYAYFNIMALNCEGYDYLDEIKELAEQAADTIESFLEEPISSVEAQQMVFFDEFTNCVSNASAIIDVITDEINTISDTMFS